MQSVHLNMRDLPRRFNYPSRQEDVALDSVRACGRTLAANRDRARFAGDSINVLHITAR
jgi:hypothetical protein